MAIAFDAASNSGAQTTPTTYSWNHTCTGSELVLAVAVGQRTTAGNLVSGITYNGVALTQGPTINNGSRRADIWYLKNPATGTHSVAVTLSAAPTTSGAMAVSLIGVDQTNPLDASNTNTGTSTSPSVSVTTIANNAWILDCFSGGSGTATSYTTSQTDRNAITLGSGFFTEQSSLGPVTPAGATSMAGTLGGSSPIWSHVAASFKPSTPTTIPNKILQVNQSVNRASTY